MKMFPSLAVVVCTALLGDHIAEGYFLVPSRGIISATNQGPWSGKVSFAAIQTNAQKAGKMEEQAQREEPKYPFLHACHERLAKVFGRDTDIWYHDWKLWVGSALWFSVWGKWLKHGYDEVYYQRFLFAFGINIVILHHLQFAHTIPIGMFGVCVLLGAQASFQSAFMFKEEHRDLKDGEETFVCETLYLDLSLPPEQIIVLFVAQFCVWWFYMTSILHNFDFNHVNYMYWLVAFLAMQMTMIFNRGDDSVLGKPFPCHEVYRLVKNSSRIKVHEVDDTGFTIKGSTPFRVSRMDLFMRGVFGYFVNAICREILAYTIPLMLMGFESPMDFVVYCVGVNFICTLDDMQTKDFALKVSHTLEVGDLVVAKLPAYGHISPSPRTPRSKAIDSPWFAGTVTAIDTKKLTCTVKFEDGSESSDVWEHDMYYSPGRDPRWGTGEFSDPHHLPEDVVPVRIRASGD
jgi:hypothetical protein